MCLQTLQVALAPPDSNFVSINIFRQMETSYVTDIKSGCKIVCCLQVFRECHSKMCSEYLFLQLLQATDMWYFQISTARTVCTVDCSVTECRSACLVDFLGLHTQSS
jgi:hypothetical protein